VDADNPLLLVGCGKMGGALLAGWLDGGIVAAEAVTVVEPADIPLPEGVRRVADAVALDDAVKPEIVVFAVKPQAMDDVVPAYARYAAGGTVFLSIAAGRPIAYFETLLDPAAAIVRAMPNTPAAVGRGVTVLCANARVPGVRRETCAVLLGAVGAVEWIDDEALMDAVTAVSGSGPAYVFLLAEELAKAGVAAGLPEALARKLARLTVAGSGELLMQSDDSAATLRENVTSPGGTTAAALAVLMAEDGLSPLLARAVDAATRRSRELAG
jgi:pyrroline-5-carboxylate reductase